MSRAGTVEMGHHTANVMSQIMESGTQNRVPEVGMGVTINYYTDRYVGTIIEASEKRIVVQEDDVKADTTKAGGMGHQDWIITPNDKGVLYVFTKRKNGRWVREGDGLHKGLGCTIGIKNYYRDWSF